MESESTQEISEEQRARQIADCQGEIRQAVDEAGELEAWATECFANLAEEDILTEACKEVASEWLTSDPPQIGKWEHLLVTIAMQSAKNRKHCGLCTCEVLVRQLEELLDANGERFDRNKKGSITSALTVVLAVQDRLTQEIRDVVGKMCDGQEELLAEIAEQCQDILRRRGQMSGKLGLFVWDIRREEWRLAKDFKPYKPE